MKFYCPTKKIEGVTDPQAEGDICPACGKARPEIADIGSGEHSCNFLLTRSTAKGARGLENLYPRVLQLADEINCWLYDPQGKKLISRKEAAARRQAADFADVMTVCNTCMSMACYY